MTLLSEEDTFFTFGEEEKLRREVKDLERFRRPSQEKGNRKGDISEGYVKSSGLEKIGFWKTIDLILL